MITHSPINANKYVEQSLLSPTGLPYLKKIPVGSIVESGTLTFTVDRSNGYVISGRDSDNQPVAIDLRTTNAMITQLPVMNQLKYSPTIEG